MVDFNKSNFLKFTWSVSISGLCNVALLSVSKLVTKERGLKTVRSGEVQNHAAEMAQYIIDAPQNQIPLASTYYQYSTFLNLWLLPNDFHNLSLSPSSPLFPSSWSLLFPPEYRAKGPPRADNVGPISHVVTYACCQKQARAAYSEEHGQLCLLPPRRFGTTHAFDLSPIYPKDLSLTS